MLGLKKNSFRKMTKEEASCARILLSYEGEKEKTELIIDENLNNRNNNSFYLGNSPKGSLRIKLNVFEIKDDGIVFSINFIDNDPTYVTQQIDRLKQEKNIIPTQEDIEELYVKPRQEFIDNTKSRLLSNISEVYTEDGKNLIFIKLGRSVDFGEYMVKLEDIIYGTYFEC